MSARIFYEHLSSSPTYDTARKIFLFLIEKVCWKWRSYSVCYLPPQLQMFGAPIVQICGVHGQMFAVRVSG
jgi:hypothetical protein